MATGGCLISSGVAMGINNAYAIPTIIAGASEIVNTLLLPLGSTHNNTELQEVFTDERAGLINDSVVDDYQSINDSSSNYSFDGSELNINARLEFDENYYRL
ncbi:hypothetical protein [Spiroplasma endosymbiont of Nebria brevicollis]|uniref:hypothetical protein n=1 Tax=Spiroplasma endosymbiont of Nebria brevicollis TaxID=3066284 RepID=UPI00313B1816